MFFSSQKSFEDAIKPLLVVNCHSGIGTFRLSNQSIISYYYMQLHTLIILILNLVAMYTALPIIYQASNITDVSPMAFIMYSTLVYVNCCFTVIGPCIVWMRRKGLRDCLRQVQILDDVFESIFGVRNEYKKFFIRMTCQVIIVFCIMIVVFAYDFQWTSAYSWSWWTIFCIALTVHHPILVMLVLDLNFSSFVRYLEKKFRDLNNALLKLAEAPDSIPNPDGRQSKNSRSVLQKKVTRSYRRKNVDAESLNDNLQSLREIQKAHLELCKLTRRVNTIFGIQNLMSSGISFGVITGFLYTIYSAVEYKKVASDAREEIVPSTIWCLIYASKIIIVNHCCSKVSLEAQRTGEVIYEFLKLESVDQLQREQIQLFALQMYQNPIRFDACGFFILDYTFVQGIIGSITTYLIILIQMSQLSGETTNTSMAYNPLNNGTEI